MTHPALGRAVPVHFAMADLAGWGANNEAASWRDRDDADYGPLREVGQAATHICFGRVSLVRMTLEDFGFDLLAWRAYLLDAPNPDMKREKDGFGYGHPYAARTVDRIVQEAVDHPDRAEREAVAQAIWPDEVQKALAWYQKEWKDEDEPVWLAAIRDWPFKTGAMSADR